MAGPPTLDSCEFRFNFVGVALPYGAHPAIGARTPDGTIADNLRTITEAAEDLVVATLPSTVSLSRVDMKLGPVATGPTYSQFSGISGGQGAEAEGPQVCGLIRKTIEGVSGRFAGRMFWPAPAAASIQTGGLLNPATLNAWATAFSEFYDVLIDVCEEVRVFPADSSDFRVVQALQPQPRCATLRRRNRR